MTKYGKELAAMKKAALLAMKIAQRYAEKGFTVRMKSHRQPVTEADVECETAIRRVLGRAFPTYGFLGEEQAAKLATGRHSSRDGHFGTRFLIDPIDGTKPFTHHFPIYGPLLALEVNGEIVAGVAGISGFRELYWAEKGRGAFCSTDGGPARRIHVTSTKKLKDSRVVVRRRANHGDEPLPMRRVARIAKEKYNFGACCLFGMMMVASGRMDVFVNTWCNPWDHAAPKIILEEAGGRFSNQHGEPGIYGRLGKDWIIATNGKTHSEVIRTAFPRRK